MSAAIYDRHCRDCGRRYVAMIPAGAEWLCFACWRDEPAVKPAKGGRR